MIQTRSEHADKIYKLLCDGKVFEAKMEAIVLRTLLKLDENCDELIKKSNTIFEKVVSKCT